MLSQLNLRFHKKLIEALKVRAGRENTSVNALAERFLDDGLTTAAAGDGYFQLVADPEATVRQLYRHIILGQTFGSAPISRDELRFMLTYAREAFMRGHGRLATLPALRILLTITRDLLAWQVANDRTVDGPYLKGIFRTDGQSPGQRPGAWYDTPRLHLMITGQDFVVPCDWAAFCELLGLFTLYARHPEVLAQGHHGERVMFSPPGHVTKEGFFGIDGLRIFLSAEAFETLVRELTTRCAEAMLAEALTGLRCLYGDL
ncbi:transcriptional regulator [Salmonella enterica]